MQGYMESEKINDIVEGTFTKVDLSVVNKHHGLNWKGQLQAVLNFVPGCGGFLAQELQNYLDYRDNEFLRKYTTYIMELSDISVDDRLEFAKEVGAKAKDAPGNVIANMVDSLDNINKERYYARLSKARIRGDISIEDFFRLTTVLVRIPYTDLDNLPLYQHDYYDEDGDTELLYSTGVLRMAEIGEEGDKYILSPLGVKFMKWALESPVEVKKISGTSTSMAWSPIGEDEIDEITDKHGAEKQYKESDQAMFDYDVLRGK